MCSHLLYHHIHLAVARCDNTVARLLITWAGKDCKPVDVWAAHHGDVSVLAALPADWARSEFPAHIAAASGRAEAFWWCVRSGWPWSARESLEYASANGHSQLMVWLLNYHTFEAAADHIRTLRGLCSSLAPRAAECSEKAAAIEGAWATGGPLALLEWAAGGARRAPDVLAVAARNMDDLRAHYPLNPHVVDVAAACGDLDTFRAAIRTHSWSVQSALTQAIEFGAEEIADFLREGYALPGSLVRIKAQRAFSQAFVLADTLVDSYLH